MVGKYPDFKGFVQRKIGEKQYENIGESAAWKHGESFITGRLVFDADAVIPDSEGKITVNFSLSK